MKRMKCYIYTRVSTSMQVDGYSLDAQKDKLRKYAEFQNMLVAGEYCDEGKSGKNIEGRPEFLRMLRDIESGKDGVSFVLVFKLSRFGRNAADVLTSLQRMQDFGVNLICVEDGIDSSKDLSLIHISFERSLWVMRLRSCAGCANTNTTRRPCGCGSWAAADACCATSASLTVTA